MFRPKGRGPPAPVPGTKGPMSKTDPRPDDGSPPPGAADSQAGPTRRADRRDPDRIPPGSYIYFGNLFPTEAQYRSGLFHGLALHPRFDRDYRFDAASPLPFADASMRGFQSQDVFEHVAYDRIPGILDDIFRCLMPGGLFRLSLPDYNSPVMKRRSVYDSSGRILCDIAMGGVVGASANTKVTVSFRGNPGDAHLWFPTHHAVLRLIVASQIRLSSAIVFHHAWIDGHDCICNSFDESIMPVMRTPPADMRAGGKPVSIVVDFIK
jgi:hypothetical protein